MPLLNATLIHEEARPTLGPVGAATSVARRNLHAFRRYWMAFCTGFLEPVLYLFSIGIGVGGLVGDLEVNGHRVEYAAFVAPALLATSAMNGAMYDAAFNFYGKLRDSKLFSQMLATPLSTSDVARGELLWSLFRGGLYVLVFWIVMTALGYSGGWLGLLALPAALLVCWAFGTVFMALSTFVRGWQDFDYLTILTMPMFLFSATFFPVTAYPDWLRWVVEVTPLYRAVVLLRELCTGEVGLAAAVSVLYLVVLGLVGMAVAPASSGPPPAALTLRIRVFRGSGRPAAG